MIILKSNWFMERLSKINGFSVIGICLFPFIIVSSKAQEYEINHERIHWCQQLETLVIGFYIIYGLNYLYYRLKGKSHFVAYNCLFFEKEAYNNQANLGYLKMRKIFAWARR